MAPRRRKVNDIRNSKLLAGFKLQQARSTADTDVRKKNEVICLSSDTEVICLSDKQARQKPAKILNSVITDKKLLAQAMCYGPDENPNKKEGGRPRMVKDDAFVFGTGSMYASAAHFLFNRVVIEEGTFRGRSGQVKVVKSVLNETIWELARMSAENEKKRKRREKATSYDPFSKRPKKIEKVNWSTELKAIAVEELYNTIPPPLREDCKAWKNYTADAVRSLAIKSSAFKSLQQAHLYSWYKKFYDYIDLNQFDFDDDAFMWALRDQRAVSNDRAAIVPKQLRALLIDLVSEVIAQKLEINTTILRPFLLRYIKEHDAFKHILADNSKFNASRSWIRRLLKEAGLSYRAITNDAGMFMIF